MFTQKPRERKPLAFPKAISGGRQSPVSGAVVAVPKTVAHRNRDLLDLARGQDCLLRIPSVCTNDTETTVAAHSNWHADGKSGARKANDHMSVWACARCHSWLDGSYIASMEQKQLAFYLAHDEQIIAWKFIVADSSQPSKARKAAFWALDMLKESK